MKITCIFYEDYTKILKKAKTSLLKLNNYIPILLMHILLKSSKYLSYYYLLDANLGKKLDK